MISAPAAGSLAFDLYAHVLHAGFDQFEREIRLAILLLDEDVLAIVDLDRVAIRAQPGGERIANVPGDIVLFTPATDGFYCDGPAGISSTGT